MIAERSADYEVTSTVTGRSVQMGIAQNALAHIMDVLTNLYGDRQMAVVREYSTNARDAHIEIGNTDPIEVTLPSALSPFLKIKDFGVGLSENDIAEVYSQYGASTKRETNAQNGMLGLGCKSALTYSSQFSVVSVKDHVRTTVSVSRDEDGIASMTTIETIPTTEHSGTEIVIPARPGNQFEEKAETLFAYWDEGTVLVNGKQPERVEGLEVAVDQVVPVTLNGRASEVTIQKLLVVEDSPGNMNNVVVMGGVPYPARDETAIPASVRGPYHLVAFVGIGDVNFAPSREKLMDTARTKETVAAIGDLFGTKVNDAIQTAIDKLDSPREALRVAARWREVPSAFVVKDFEYTFKGAKIPFSFKPPMLKRVRDDGVEEEYTKRWTVTDRNSSILSHVSNPDSVYVGTAMSAMWVYGYNYGKFTASHKKKLKQYAEENGIDVRHFVLHPGKIDSPWIEDSQIVNWDDVNKIKLEVNYSPRTGNRPSGSYDMRIGGVKQIGILAAAIDLSKPILYFNTTDYGDFPALLNEVDIHLSDATVVLVTANREAKFKRDFPQARSAQEALLEVFKEVRRKITKKSLTAYAIEQNTNRTYWYKRLDASKVDDPELRYAVQVANGKGLSKKVRMRIHRANTLSKLVGKGDLLFGIKTFSVKERYPLVDTYSSIHPHTYIYLNAAYAVEKKES